MTTSDPQKDASIPRRQAAFTVAPSPLNTVKLDLAVILCLNLLLWLVHPRLTSDPWAQLAILAGGGLAGMVWLVVRTRRVLARNRTTRAGGED